MPILRGKKKTKLIEDYYDKRQRVNRLNKELEELREEIDQNFAYGEFETHEHNINIIEKERNYLDHKKVAKFVGNKINRCYSSTPYMSIIIKEKKEAI